MPKDFYSDGEPEAESMPAESPDEATKQTALVPKEFCPGMNPGDEFTARVTRAAEDQYEIEYVEKGESETESESEPETAAPMSSAEPAIPPDANYE